MRIPREFLLAILCVYLHDIYAVTLSQSSGKFARDKRYLVYTPPKPNAATRVQLILGLGLPMEVDVSMIIGYVLKFNYNLPYNASYLTDPYVRYDRSISRRVEPDENDASPSNAKASLISRWECYKILESLFESTRSGKACLLKTICEAATMPFGRSHTLTAQFAHIFLTPSTTSESYGDVFDQEYHAAEIAGQQDPSNCDNLYPECTESLLDYFTEIY
ncbi:hypothetical protein EAG_06423 [Camponotus floridanus]|uniref:Uncharacterized protein n=1 Tax=Camponotus floridanus TaxID=104421 RepID=E1ZY82_CAMFO|nr:uncharacterized protein LOC112639523 [Camponotus floridanus]EFN73781.1 hypothetical protein EAG_06423 [Camponotus floridanus]